jgi:Nitrile hydratase, alpha chain
MQEQQLDDPEHAIRIRALRDDEFRQALIRDPEETLAREFGVRVPEGVRIQVHEETDDLVHLIVPAPPSKLEKLSDRELEMMPQDPQAKTGCCTCGSSTEQTFSSLQKGCGC